MPVFRLTHDIIFPPPHLAEDGLLAVGGDLSRERLLLAYGNGIFPWYSEEQPLLWWSPDPRMIITPGGFHCSRSLRRTLKQAVFTLTMDTAFAEVINACAEVPRLGQDGTWITPEMREAYVDLHEAGYAHSVECWREGRLAGGLYGVSLGAAFFGESMFSLASDASKAALARLVWQLEAWGIRLVDCQTTTPHLKRMGGREVPRAVFLNMLRKAMTHPTRQGKWRFNEAG